MTNSTTYFHELGADVCSEFFPMPIYRHLLAAAVLLIFAAGCGGEATGSAGGNGGSSGPSDTTSPSVSSMTPGEDTVGRAGTNGKLTATFSESMEPSLINTANFRLTDGVSAMPGTVSYDPINHIAVFTPTNGFTPGTRYTATVITGVKDLSNNTLNTDFAWCFVTGGAADNSAPSVTSTFPANNVTDVPVNRKITATFSEEMNSFTLTAATFKLTGAGSTPVPGAVTYRGGMAVFTPAQNLAANAAYTATVFADATDLAGNRLQAIATWSFTTGATADVAAPLVVSTSPDIAATNVALNSTIDIRFNKPMDPATITTANFMVTGPGATPVIGTVSFDASSKTATFTRINHRITPVAFHPEPVTNLEPNTVYTVRLGTGARDMAGNALNGNPVWSFTTAQ